MQFATLLARPAVTMMLMACALAPAVVHAQTTPPTTPPPPAYKYSVSLSIAAPAGSSAAAATADKTLPVATKFTPCDATKLDQFAFTIKYDAGKVAADLQNVYLIFHKPELATNGYFPLVRRSITSAAPFFTVYNTAAQILPADTYVAATANVGGAQTEVVLGGNLPLEGMDAGLWMVTAIIAPGTSVNFDDPSTWKAWDSIGFLLRKPWRGASNTTCQ